MRSVLLNVNTFHRSRHTPLGSLGNDNGDRNENGRKAIDLDWQNNNFERASRFFVHFFAVFPVVASLRPKNNRGRRERSDDRKYVCGSHAISAPLRRETAEFHFLLRT